VDDGNVIGKLRLKHAVKVHGATQSDLFVLSDQARVAPPATSSPYQTIRVGQQGENSDVAVVLIHCTDGHLFFLSLRQAHNQTETGGRNEMMWEYPEINVMKNAWRSREIRASESLKKRRRVCCGSSIPLRFRFVRIRDMYNRTHVISSVFSTQYSHPHPFF
jgi:hypothetical protein